MTVAEPAFWMKLAVISAVNSPVDVKSVIRGLLFQYTVVAGVKLPPFTVRVKPGWPASMLAGTSVIVCAGVG